MKINQLYEAKALDEIPVCPQERLVIISNTTGLSFALERIGPLAAIIITVFYLLVLYLSALSKTPKNLFASIYSDFLIKTASQHTFCSSLGSTLLFIESTTIHPLYLWVITYQLIRKISSESMKYDLGVCWISSVRRCSLNFPVLDGEFQFNYLHYGLS
jgi:hypothetical protein